MSFIIIIGGAAIAAGVTETAQEIIKRNKVKRHFRSNRHKARKFV